MFSGIKNLSAERLIDLWNWWWWSSLIKTGKEKA